jgi:site-specific DNA-cytosine methylase
MACTIPQPEDKGLLLRDVLEEDVDEKYLLSDKMLNYFDKRAKNFNQGKVNLREENGKASCLTSSMASCDISDNFVLSGTWRTHHDGKGFREIKSGKAATIPARAREDGSGQNVVAIPEATKKGYAEIKPGECFDATFPESKTRRGRLMEDKSNCLTATKYDFMHYDTNYRIRRLTPVECERLQTVDDNYTAHVSDTQRYKMLGNGWTVDVIVHILSYMDSFR